MSSLKRINSQDLINEVIYKDNNRRLITTMINILMFINYIY